LLRSILFASLFTLLSFRVLPLPFLAFPSVDDDESLGKSIVSGRRRTEPYTRFSGPCFCAPPRVSDSSMGFPSHETLILFDKEEEHRQILRLFSSRDKKMIKRKSQKSDEKACKKELSYILFLEVVDQAWRFLTNQNGLVFFFVPARKIGFFLSLPA